MSDLAQFDPWLTTDNFAALVIREYLEPVEGPDGVLFPATYAAAEDKKVFPGGYNIDPPEGDKNVCLVDSVGSQANRIEPMFAKPDYAHLIPQISVKAGEKLVSILEAGHRAGDALVRCTALQKDLQNAFKAVLKGNAEPMAKIAPTSLVFGVWDSRDTQAKLPRLVASTIRAFDVKRLRRSAQFSATPFVVTRYLKLRGTKRDRPEDYASPRDFAQHILQQELKRRSDLPQAASIESVESIGTHRLRSIQFKRFRSKQGDDGGRRPAGGFRITFAVSVHGPLCLGHSCHFGLGLFLPSSPFSGRAAR